MRRVGRFGMMGLGGRIAECIRPQQPLVRNLGDDVGDDPLRQARGHVRVHRGDPVLPAQQHVVADQRERLAGLRGVAAPAVVEYSAAPWSIRHSLPCQTSMFGLRAVRSTLLVNASNQTTREASSASGCSATGSKLIAPDR